MKRRFAMKVGSVVLVAAILTTRVDAFLGFGDIVFDPSNYQQAVQQLVQLERQYTQLVQSYLTLRNQYDHMVRMAQQVPVNMALRYRALPTSWQRFQASPS
jgi:conjugal transfer/entry exclusion protein